MVDLAAPLGDLTTLPLVSGEYMTSLGRGHDGLIEIRQPGGEAVPLVLDYRDPKRPMRLRTRLRSPNLGAIARGAIRARPAARPAGAAARRACRAALAAIVDPMTRATELNIVIPLGL